MMTRLLAATIVGGIAFFIIGFLIYGVVLDPMVMKPNLNNYPGLVNETPLFVPLIAANLVSAFLLTYIFDRWASISTFMGGLKAGAIILFLMALSFQLMFISFINLSKNCIPPVADVVGSTVMGALCGGIIGAVLGAMKKEKAAE
jgi:hypothetical protein